MAGFKYANSHKNINHKNPATKSDNANNKKKCKKKCKLKKKDNNNIIKKI